MRKFLSGTVCGLLLGLILTTAGVALADNPIKLIVNGKEVVSDTPPQNINGRVMVPVRFVAQALGADVQWDGANNAVVITSETQQQSTVSDQQQSLSDQQQYPVSETQESQFATIFINGTKQEIFPSPVLITDQVFVPINFIVEQFNSKFEWVEINKRAQLYWPNLDGSIDSDKLAVFTVGENEFGRNLGSAKTPEAATTNLFPTTLTIAPYIEDNQLMLPLRLIVEWGIKGHMDIQGATVYITWAPVAD